MRVPERHQRNPTGRLRTRRSGRLAWLAAGFALALHGSGPAHAHDWYDERQTDNGERCCTGLECGPLAAGDVAEVTGGYLVRSLGVVVPFSRVQPSPDGRFHACVWWIPDPTLKCFFAPPPGS